MDAKPQANSKRQPDPKRHHTVPQMLLRRFADPASPEQVWQIPARGDKPPFVTSIENASVVGYFYTMYRDRPQKGDDPWWEKQLAEWEGRAGEVLHELLVRKRMRGPIGALVELQILRSSLGQALLADEVWDERRRVFGSGDDRDWARWFTLRKRRPPDYSEYVALKEAGDAVRRGEVPELLAAGPTAVLEHMRTVILESGFSGRLWAGTWSVLEDEYGRFVIGDVPVTYTGVDDQSRPVWRQERLPEQMTLPLGPTACLEVRREPRLSMPFGFLTDEEIHQINRRAFEWATRWVFGADRELLEQERAAHRRKGREAPPPQPVHPRRVR